MTIVAARDNLTSCFKPDNAQFYLVTVGTPCRPGDHFAYPCYLPGGVIVGIQRGMDGPNLECRSRGGNLSPLLIKQ